MKKQPLPKILTVFGLFTIFFSLQADAAIKCWTNNEGVRECGNLVPPEYVQQGHQEISESGMVINEQSRARTKEELSAEAEKLKILEQEKHKQAEQKRADDILLATFANVTEIEWARDERIEAIDANITLANKQTETIQQDLDKRIQAAADAERGGNTPNDTLLKDIEDLERQMASKKEYIAGLEKEKEATIAEYAASIQRFKNLKEYNKPRKLLK
jgi:carboxylesterase type B